MKLFNRCSHQWETIEVRDLLSRRNDDHIGRMYELRCSKCGDIKFRKVMI